MVDGSSVEGGLSLMVIRSIKDIVFIHFDYVEFSANNTKDHVRLCLFYRSQTSRQNGFKSTTIFNEWSTFVCSEGNFTVTDI